MADTELSSKLYEKVSAEQDKFRAWLMDQPPADILNHAVEYAVREDILMEIEALELPTRPSPRWPIPGIWMWSGRASRTGRPP